MPMPINWPGDSNAVRQLFGLKGRVTLGLDESVVPVVIIGDADQSPWGGSLNVGRGAFIDPLPALNAYAVAQPGGGVVLRIDQINIGNDTGTVIDWHLNLLTPAQIATLTIATTFNFQNLQSPIQADGALDRTASVLLEANVAGIIGTQIDAGTLPANDHDVIPLPNPVYLDSAAAGGVGGLAIIADVVNTGILVAFNGREYFHRS